jgi:hypothetical protein
MAVTMATTMAAIVVAAATVTASAVCSEDKSSNSNGRGHRQQSIKSGSKDMVAVTEWKQQPLEESSLETWFGETGLKIQPDAFRHDNCERINLNLLTICFLTKQK